MRKLTDLIQKKKMKQEGAAQKPAEAPDSIDPNEQIPKHFKQLTNMLKDRIGYNVSYDIGFREMEFAGARTGILFLNGMINELLLSEIMERLTVVPELSEEQPAVETFEKALIPHTQVNHFRTMTEVVGAVMTGKVALFVEGEQTAVIIDVKNYPARTTSEPDLERVVRGSRDGFIESLLYNTALIRRRLRDPKLRFEIAQVGKRTATDISLGYIEDIADPDLVAAVRNKLKQIDLGGIPMAEKQLEEALVKSNGFNPYPLVRYSERPDVIAAHLLEGHIVLFVDTSPSAMIIPTTFFHHVQHAEEFRQTPLIGTYLRWIRFIGIIGSIFLLPMWYLLIIHPELKPAMLAFIEPKKIGEVPILAQLLIAELGVDLLRMASVHTPTPLATAMGLVATILIGDIAVKVGLFNNEVILYVAVTALGRFATPSYELSLANRIVQLLLLLLTAVFDIIGLVVGTTLWFILLVCMRSYNSPYMWPLIPFNAKALIAILIRRPVNRDQYRLSLVKPVDNTEQRPK